MLYLVEGPAGGGKSQHAREMLEAGEAQVLADVTSLWAAIGGHERGPDGRYPVRSDDDPALALARYVQAAVVREGLREGQDVVVTTSRRDQQDRWSEVAAAAATSLSVRTIDPGRSVVEARLADPQTGILSADCESAIARWYG